MPTSRSSAPARNFKGPDGVSYRSGWIVLRDNSVRGRTMIVTHALYGDVAYGPGVERTPPFDESAPPDEHAAACARVAHDREVLRVQNGRLSSQSGTWERRINLGRGPTSATYNRLSQAMGALDELIFTLERRLYSCS
jgi:hypothetical protein